MNAADGNFNSGTENVTKALTATQFNALSQGTHTIFVHGKDQAGNWGATQSKTFVKNTAPTANDQSVSAAEDTPKAITLTASDPDNCELTFSIVTGPSHGSLG